MGMGGPPKFKVGDRVIDFRGNTAVIVSAWDSNDPGKSNRVEVIFDGDMKSNGITFYESVFEKIEEENKILYSVVVPWIENPEYNQYSSASIWEVLDFASMELDTLAINEYELIEYYGENKDFELAYKAFKMHQHLETVVLDINGILKAARTLEHSKRAPSFRGKDGDELLHQSAMKYFKEEGEYQPLQNLPEVYKPIFTINKELSH